MNFKTIAIAAGALVLLAVGFLFFQSPKPIIEIKGEKLADIGFFPLLNTYVTSVLVVIMLCAVTYFGLRKLNMVPGGLQNVIEGVAEALYNICITTAGEKNARRFFPVIATIFVYIWIANWMALLPGFLSIGKVQEVSAHHFHHEATVLRETAGIGFIMPGQGEIEFHVDEAACAPIDDEIDEAKAAGHDTAELKEAKKDCIEHERERAIDAQLAKAAGIKVDTSACEDLHDHEKEVCETDIKLEHAEEARAKLDADGKKIGIVIPYLRSMNTDINSPLSIAIMALIFIEFWGITALGFFKYAGKFLNFSSPIYFFVGILEFIAEIARIISFTFRLFGNMLAGEILLLVMTFLAPFLVALPFYGLEVFVGAIQAFVFAMLTLVFAVLAVSSHEGHDDEQGHDNIPDLPLEGAHIPATH